jgi:hypothetical protein
MPLIPYSLNAGCNTPLGQALIHKEHAVQSLVKFAILKPPGGHTGKVLFSLTVDFFFGMGTPFSLAFNDECIPVRSNIITATAPLLLSSVLCSLLFSFTIPYEIALSWHVVTQLKQFTHLETSILLFKKSMQCDLHLTAHLPHLVHDDSSCLIRSKEIFESNPRKVPTGHIILQ